MRMRWMCLGVMAMGVVGCGMEPMVPLGAGVNARLAKQSGVESADVVVRTRCVSCEEYGMRQRGNWVWTWYLVKCDVTAVETGHWAFDRRLVFVATDAWPTVESGILLDKEVWHFRPGVELRLWVCTGKDVPEIRRVDVVDSGKVGVTSPASEGKATQSD